MNQTAKTDPNPSQALDDDALNEIENNEVAELLGDESDPNYLTNAEFLDDGLLDSDEDLDSAAVVDDQLSFIRGED
ncbi:MAG: hypothetical protein E2O55_01485 [Gammaproteobacteria bacterium]|nr:MAG: hypothetical protein E2O55_01485 [Gammaproteobacteria bacterium]